MVITRVTLLLTTFLVLSLSVFAAPMTNWYTDTITHTGSDSGSTFLIDTNRSNFTYIEINITWQLTGNNATNAAGAGPKFYWDSSSSSHGAENAYFEWDTASVNWSLKDEPHFSTYLANKLYNNITITYKINWTLDNITICIGATCSTPEVFTDNRLNYTSISWGPNGSRQNITRYSVDIMTSEWYNTTIPTPAAPGVLSGVWLTSQNGSISYGNATTMTYNFTCTGGNCSNVLLYHDPFPASGSSMCGSTYTCQQLLDLFANDYWRDNVDENISSTSTKMAAGRWHTTEGTCTTGGIPSQGTGCQDQLQTGGGSCPTVSISGHQYCWVSDEGGNGYLIMAVGSNQTRFEYLHRFIMTLRSSSANNLICWKAYINGQQNYSSTSACSLTDSASDGDLRILGAMGIACAKQKAGIWSIGGDYESYCVDYEALGASIWGPTTTSHGDIILDGDGKAWMAGGWVTAGFSPDGTNYAYYPDYQELWALQSYAEYENNATKLQYVKDLIDLFNRSTMVNGAQSAHVSYGALLKATNSTGRQLICTFDSYGTNPCIDDQIFTDSTDRFREFPALGTTYSLRPNIFTNAMNTSITQYWYNNYMLPYTPTGNMPYQVYANISRGIRSSDNSYKSQGIWLPLAVGMNPTRAALMIDYIASSSIYNNTPGFGKFINQAYMGAYFGGFTIRAVALYAGQMDPLEIYGNWTNSSGLAPAGGKGVTPVGSGSPFWVTEANPYSCGNMTSGQSCSTSWTVHANANVGQSYTVYTFATSTNSDTAQTINGNWTILPISSNDTWVLQTVKNTYGISVDTFDINLSNGERATNVVPPMTFTNNLSSWTAIVTKAGYFPLTTTFTTVPAANTHINITGMGNSYFTFLINGSSTPVSATCSLNVTNTSISSGLTTLGSGTYNMTCPGSTGYTAFSTTFTKNDSDPLNLTVTIGALSLYLTFDAPTTGTITWGSGSSASTATGGIRNFSVSQLLLSTINFCHNGLPCYVDVTYNNAGSGEQHYEFYNDYTTGYAADLHVFSSMQNYLSFKTVTITDNPVRETEIIVRWLNVSSGTSVNESYLTVGRRYTDPSGFADFYLPSTGFIEVYAIKEGYGLVHETLEIDEHANQSRSNPYKLLMQPAATTYMNGTYIYIDDYFLNDTTSMTIWGYTQELLYLKYNTTANPALQSFTIDPYSKWGYDTLTMCTGTNNPSNSACDYYQGVNFTVMVYDGLDNLLTTKVIMAYSYPQRDITATLRSRINTPIKIILLILLIVLSGYIGLTINKEQGTSGYTVFTIGIMALCFISTTFIIPAIFMAIITVAQAVWRTQGD